MGVAKESQKGAKREPKGAKMEPKVSQRTTKMHPKIDLRKRSRKGCQNYHQGLYCWDHLGSLFLLKIDEQIDAKIFFSQVIYLFLLLLFLNCLNLLNLNLPLLFLSKHFS